MRHPVRCRRNRLRHVKLYGFLQVRKGFFFCLALAGNFNLDTLRDKPFALAPYARGETVPHTVDTFCIAVPSRVQPLQGKILCVAETQGVALG